MRKFLKAGGHLLIPFFCVRPRRGDQPARDSLRRLAGHSARARDTHAWLRREYHRFAPCRRFNDYHIAAVAACNCGVRETPGTEKEDEQRSTGRAACAIGGRRLNPRRSNRFNQASAPSGGRRPFHTHRHIQVAPPHPTGGRRRSVQMAIPTRNSLPALRCRAAPRY